MNEQREITPRLDAPDDALMRRVQGGSRRELVRRHAGALTSFVAQISGSAQAEDVVQEAFLRVYQERQRYQVGPSSFRSWLYRIGRNLALNTRRKNSRLRPLEAAPAAASQDPTPLAALCASDRADALREAIAALPEAERSVIALRYQRGLSYAEVGRALGLSPAAAKQRSWRALQRLRGQVEAP